jgi:hypothetical protein
MTRNLKRMSSKLQNTNGKIKCVLAKEEGDKWLLDIVAEHSVIIPESKS